jgi:hypothetical protein
VWLGCIRAGREIWVTRERCRDGEGRRGEAGGPKLVGGSRRASGLPWRCCVGGCGDGRCWELVWVRQPLRCRVADPPPLFGLPVDWLDQSAVSLYGPRLYTGPGSVDGRWGTVRKLLIEALNAGLTVPSDGNSLGWGKILEILVKAKYLLIEGLNSELEAHSAVRWHSLGWGNVSRFLEKAWRVIDRYLRLVYNLGLELVSTPL